MDEMLNDYKKLLDAFLAYVEDDAECTELTYIRNKLTDICGLSEKDCDDIGLGWVFEK